MVFANNEPVGGHLWYLMAYVYALVILALLARKGKSKWLKHIAVTGLALYFVFDIWHIYYDVPKYLSLVYCFRNFFFTAIPMIYIGATMVKRRHVNPKTIATSIVIFSICALVEMNCFHVNHIADVYFFTIPLSVSLLSLFVNCKITKPNILTKWGERYSLYIYILHPIIIKLLTNEFGKDTCFVGVMAFVLTLLVSVVYVTIKDKVKYISNLDT